MLDIVKIYRRAYRPLVGVARLTHRVSKAILKISSIHWRILLTKRFAVASMKDDIEKNARKLKEFTIEDLKPAIKSEIEGKLLLLLIMQ